MKFEDMCDESVHEFGEISTAIMEAVTSKPASESRYAAAIYACLCNAAGIAALTRGGRIDVPYIRHLAGLMMTLLVMAIENDQEDAV